MHGRHYGPPPSAEDERKKSKRELLKSSIRLISYLRPYWVLAALLLFVNIAIIGLNLLNPFLTGILVDRAIIPRDMRALKVIVLVVLGALGARSVLAFLFSYFSHLMGQKVIYKLRTELFEHMQNLSVRFFESTPTGEIMSRVTSDSDQVEHLMVHAVDSLLTAVLTLAGIAVFMFVTNARLASLAIIPIPLIVVQVVFFTPRFREIFRNTRQVFADLNTFLQERVSGVRIVKSFGTEKHEALKFRDLARQYYDVFMRAVLNFSLFGPAMGLVSGIGGILVMYYGGRLVISGEMTIGKLVTFLMFTAMFYNPIRALGQLFGHWLPRSLAAADRIFDFLDEEDKLEVLPGAIEPERLEGRIEFRNVTFRYDKNDVLKNFDLTIAAGETVALVGRSGVGKTTLADLVSRFYDPQEGSVLVDGVDVRRYEPIALRRQIGVVLQEPFLFNASVRDNIAYGKPEVSEEEVRAAAREAGASEFIEQLDDGYDSIVGERGVKLSVGEKQRISIARALIKDPAILVLDEATSSVDTPTERVIQEALGRAAVGRTTILIAHRLSTTTMADRIIVLEGGAIAEHGPHAELIEGDGIFAKLWQMQMPDSWLGNEEPGAE